MATTARHHRESDPVQLAAIRDLRRLKWSNSDIMEVLNISRATLYRRLAELEDREESRAGRPAG